MFNQTPGNVGSKILIALGRILALLVALILCIPVFLLPIATNVPALVWIVLIVLAVGFIGLQFRRRAAALAGSLLVCILAVLASQFFAATPAITGADGKPLPGSIAVLEQVTLNGSKQWISIRGKDVNKPVLLFLAGGPGGSQLVTERRALAGLENHFVVVNWEQPGAAKSFELG